MISPSTQRCVPKEKPPGIENVRSLKELHSLALGFYGCVVDTQTVKTSECGLGHSGGDEGQGAGLEMAQQH